MWCVTRWPRGGHGDCARAPAMARVGGPAAGRGARLRAISGFAASQRHRGRCRKRTRGPMVSKHAGIDAGNGHIQIHGHSLGREMQAVTPRVRLIHTSRGRSTRPNSRPVVQNRAPLCVQAEAHRSARIPTLASNDKFQAGRHHPKMGVFERVNGFCLTAECLSCSSS